jgi:DNA-binding NarL/FixJ family response regulator
MIRIIVADDQVLFREGLQVLLQSEDDIVIAGEAADGIEVMDRFHNQQVDLVITDIQMPELNGVELTKLIKEHYSQVHVIGLTMFPEDYLIVDMLEAGAKGYLLKSAPKKELVDAIKAVHVGGYYFCNQTSLKLSKMIAGSKINPFVQHQAGRFNDTELQLMQLVCEEYSSKEISERLHLGIRTVESYRHRLFEKTGDRNMAGLVIYAIRYGIYQPKPVSEKHKENTK